MFKILYFFEHIKLVRDNVIKITDIQYSYNVELRKKEKTIYIYIYIYILWSCGHKISERSKSLTS